MIASNSFSIPRVVSADPASVTWTVASSVAAQAVQMKRLIFTAPTGTPTFRATTWSPPVAKIQLPKRVWVRM